MGESLCGVVLCEAERGEAGFYKTLVAVFAARFWKIRPCWPANQEFLAASSGPPKLPGASKRQIISVQCSDNDHRLHKTLNFHTMVWQSVVRSRCCGILIFFSCSLLPSLELTTSLWLLSNSPHLVDTPPTPAACGPFWSLMEG